MVFVILLLVNFRTKEQYNIHFLCPRFSLLVILHPLQRKFCDRMLTALLGSTEVPYIFKLHVEVRTTVGMHVRVYKKINNSRKKQRMKLKLEMSIRFSVALSYNFKIWVKKPSIENKLTCDNRHNSKLIWMMFLYVCVSYSKYSALFSLFNTKPVL